VTRRALLLDLDRTLVDIETHVDYCAALADLQQRFTLPEGRATPETTGWGRCTIDVIRFLVALADTPEYPAASDLVAQYELSGAAHAKAMPGLAAFLQAIEALPRAVVTLCGPEATALVLAEHGIAADAVVPRRPDLRPKPYPDQAEAALAALGVEPDEAVVIGDSAWDLEMARAAGVPFIGVTNGRETEEFAGVPTAVDLAGAADLLGLGR
jgi:phosphoglycolate phosphatase